MQYLQNLHTHTTYCDGKNSAEEIIKRAIDLGFTALGFSGHAPMPQNIPASYAMTPEGLMAYKNEIKGLKEKYRDRLDIFLGIEFDALSQCDLSDFDYTIGSVHYIRQGDSVVDFDLGVGVVRDIIKNLFGGDGMQFAKAYYQELARLPEAIKPDIVGHFDIVAKHCEKVPFFDIESKEYKDYALEALHALKDDCKLYEVNTGGIPRGCRLSPYPSKFILKEMKNLGLNVVISSDCHNISYLNSGFEDALKLLSDCGFKEVYELTKNGFEGRIIK